MPTLNQATLNALQEELDNGNITQAQYDNILLSSTDNKSASLRNNDAYQYNQGGTSHSVTTQNGSSNTNATQKGSTTQTGSTAGSSYTDIAGIRRNADKSAVTGDVEDRIADANAIAQAPTQSLLDAIGANREKLRAQRANEAMQNAKRAKIAAWTDSARLISDIISAGAGGNVYKRDADTTAKEMYERNKALRDLEAAEDAQQALQIYQAKKAEADAALQNDRFWRQATAVQRNANTSDSSGTSSSTSNSHTNTHSSSTTDGNTSATSAYDLKPEVAATEKAKDEAQAAANAQAAADVAKLVEKTTGIVHNEDGSVTIPSVQADTNGAATTNTQGHSGSGGKQATGSAATGTFEDEEEKTKSAGKKRRSGF